MSDDWGNGFFKECYKKGVLPVKIDIEKLSWEQIKRAASESKWIPEQYYMNDWVYDVCEFLRHGLAGKP